MNRRLLVKWQDDWWMLNSFFSNLNSGLRHGSFRKDATSTGLYSALDCVVFIMGKTTGFEEVGLDVSLVKEASWASFKETVLAFGFLMQAHCLSAMLPAAALAEGSTRYSTTNTACSEL